jgi:adenine deaminase
MQRSELIRAARGERPSDLLLTNARIVDVFSGTVAPGSVAVASGRIVGFGDYPAREVRDLAGRFLAPGFIDAHVHIESSLMGVTEFARAVVARGTTTVVADPHEIANVLGAEGIRYMLRCAENQPVNVLYTLPSCVPATAMETAGATLNAADLEKFLLDPRVVALGEMMNFPGVLAGDGEVLAKLAAARRAGKPVDGHSPGLEARDLMAYIAAGITSDHECTTAREAREKLAAGMHVMIRQGSGAQNLLDLLPAVTERSSRRMMWCTDDRHPHDLVAEGHIDHILRQAVRHGVDPVTAIQMATLNPAERFGLDHLGAIAPGRQADFVVFSDLSAPEAEEVYVRGVRVAEGGRPAAELKAPEPPALRPTMRLAAGRLDFSVCCEGRRRVRIIGLVPGQIITRHLQEAPPCAGGFLTSDPQRDLLKLAVVERHRASGRIGIGLVRGIGLTQGALASSVAHDSHNIIAAGASDADMRVAVQSVADMGGGIAAAASGRVLASLALPVAGLMSNEPLAAVDAAVKRLLAAARELGCLLPDPFMTLSFLALPVIPELKLTDFGLVDVNEFKPVPLFL